MGTGDCIIVGCCGWCGAAQYCGSGCENDDIDAEDASMIFCIARNMYLFADNPGCEIGWDEEEGIIEMDDYSPC